MYHETHVQYRCRDIPQDRARDPPQKHWNQTQVALEVLPRIGPRCVYLCPSNVLYILYCTSLSDPSKLVEQRSVPVYRKTPSLKPDGVSHTKPSMNMANAAMWGTPQPPTLQMTILTFWNRKEKSHEVPRGVRWYAGSL